MTTITTWTYTNDAEDWTGEDISGGAGGPASMSYDAVNKALTATITAGGGAGPPDEGILAFVSPNLYIPVQNGDTIAADYAATSDGERTGIVVTAFYTDASSQLTTATNAIAGTLTLTMTLTKTLEHIEVAYVRGGAVVAGAETFTRNLNEVRLTTVAPGGNYSLLTPGTGAAVGAGAVAANAFSPQQDGTYLFFAMEDASGNQLFIRVDRPTSTTPTAKTIYYPAGGSIGMVAQTGDPDKMIFHGNFGTNIGVIDHAIAAETNTDITMTVIGTDLIYPLKVDPSDINHIIAINFTDQDAFETDDLGSNWSALNAALGVAAEAMDLLFPGVHFPAGGFIGGNDGVDENLSYTPNKFATLRDDASTALKAVGDIQSIDLAVT